MIIKISHKKYSQKYTLDDIVYCATNNKEYYAVTYNLKMIFDYSKVINTRIFNNKYLFSFKAIRTWGSSILFDKVYYICG